MLTGKTNPIIIQPRTTPEVLLGAPDDFPGHIHVKCQVAGKFIPNFPEYLRRKVQETLPENIERKSSGEVKLGGSL